MADGEKSLPIGALAFGVMLLSMIGSLVMLQVSASRTATAQEALAAEHKRVADHEEQGNPRVEARWTAYPLTMSLSYPYNSRTEFRDELASMLSEYRPKERQ